MTDDLKEKVMQWREIHEGCERKGNAQQKIPRSVPPGQSNPGKKDDDDELEPDDDEADESKEGAAERL